MVATTTRAMASLPRVVPVPKGLVTDRWLTTLAQDLKRAWEPLGPDLARLPPAAAAELAERAAEALAPRGSPDASHALRYAAELILESAQLRFPDQRGVSAAAGPGGTQTGLVMGAIASLGASNPKGIFGTLAELSAQAPAPLPGLETVSQAARTMRSEVERDPHAAAAHVVEFVRKTSAQLVASPLAAREEHVLALAALLRETAERLSARDPSLAALVLEPLLQGSGSELSFNLVPVPAPKPTLNLHPQTGRMLPIAVNEPWVLVRNGVATGVAAALNRAFTWSNTAYMNHAQGFDPWYLLAVPAGVAYKFERGRLYSTLGDLAARQLKRAEWLRQNHFAKDPYDVAAVRAHFQGLVERGVPTEQLLATWTSYLDTFYLHGGELRAIAYDFGSLHEDPQRLVSDLLPSRSGQRLLDCEGFSALTLGILGRLEGPDGSPRFTARAVLTDEHVATMLIDAKAGEARRWYLVNNNKVSARGTLPTGSTLSTEGIRELAAGFLGGRATVVALGASQRDAAARLVSAQSIRVGAVFVDRSGAAHVAREVDRLSYVVSAALVSDPAERVTFSAFLESWTPRRKAWRIGGDVATLAP